MSLLAVSVFVLAGIYGAALGLGAALPPAWLRGNRLILGFGVFLWLGAAAIFWLFPARTGGATPAAMFLAMQAKIVAAGLKLHGKLPVRIDETMQLTDIAAEDTAIAYRFTINAPDGDTFRGIVEDIRVHMQKDACQREDYRKMLGFGFSIVLRFGMADGREAAPMIFTPEGCGLRPKN